MYHYKPKYFRIEELVDPVTFQDRGEKALELLHADMLYSLDMMRERYGRPITVNNWHRVKPSDPKFYLDPVWRRNNGVFIFRGFRPAWCTEGGKYSQHRLGAGFDFDVQGLTAADVRADIRKHPDDPAFYAIRAVELDVPWVHVDGRNIPDKARILWVTP
jgi:hypothetical protein